LFEYLLETESDLFTSPTDFQPSGAGRSAQIVFCKGLNSDAVVVYNCMITYQSSDVNPVLT
jgi:hypothetical protein